jgi:hypothetical protein
MSLAHSPSIAIDSLSFYFDSNRTSNYVGTTVTSAVGTTQLTATNVTRSGTVTTFINSGNQSGSISASSYIRAASYDAQYVMKANTSASVTFYNTAYLNVGSLSYGRQTAFSGGSDSQIGMWAFERFTQNTNFTFRYKADNSPTYGDEFSIGTIPLNTWVNLCYTNDGSNIRVYNNGALVATHSVTSKTFASPTTDCRLSIGSQQTIYGLIGNVGIAMFYSKALTANEVAQNFNALRGRYGI